jgi:(hydroxyamino)benzene mutase
MVSIAPGAAFLIVDRIRRRIGRTFAGEEEMYSSIVAGLFIAGQHMRPARHQLCCPSVVLSRQSQRLLQVGIILVLYSSLEGFAIPLFRSERIGLSAHTLSALQSVLLLALGLLWPRLRLGVTPAGVAFWCAIYSTFAILAAYTIAAFWGVGNETIRLMGELPHGLAHGTVFQETFIKFIAYSSAPTGLTAFALILWGLRISDANSTA